MTVERWKDVLRGSAEEESHADELPSIADAEDLSELVLEHVWMPIMSSISSLWGVKSPTGNIEDRVGLPTSGMHGAQGARLGMDMAWEMLIGVRQLGRNDIFCKIFKCVCKFSGLLNYTTNAAGRAWAFSNSVEAQSAVIVALRIARDASDEIDTEGWKYVWAIIFELRDLKMLGGGLSSASKSLLRESDSDLLTDASRREWTMKLLKRGGLTGRDKKNSGGLFASVGRALFGSVDHPVVDEPSDGAATEIIRTVHGKEELVVWNELAPSDDEDSCGPQSDDGDPGFFLRADDRISIGAQFERQLIQEHMLLNQVREMGIPVTGLERVEETRSTQASPRARVRKRLSKACNFAGIISDSRFMDDARICCLLSSLLDLVSSPSKEDRSDDKGEAPPSRQNSMSEYPLSPASEAFAEVLICEIALKNRDRFNMLWYNHLSTHYSSRLKAISQIYVESHRELVLKLSNSFEKCITGLLRISRFALKRGEIADDVLFNWTILDSCEGDDKKMCILDVLDRHIGEGVWRIARCIDDTCHLSEKGWHGILSLIGWTLRRGAALPPLPATPPGSPAVGLAEDDPSLLAYRSLHFLLNVSEAKAHVPPAVAACVQVLVVTGDRRNCSKLSIAGLDLLQVLSNQIEDFAIAQEKALRFTEQSRDIFWKTNWLPVIESVAASSRMSPNPVRYLSSLSIEYSNVREIGVTDLRRFDLPYTRMFVNTHYQC
jgi:hypothetical protein